MCKLSTHLTRLNFLCTCIWFNLMVKVTRTTITSLDLSPRVNSNFKVMKQNKAVGLNDILCEQLKHLGPLWWILDMLNNCLSINNISELWRQARTVATLKPGKDPANSKSFRPIALLSHTYKLFETHSKSSGFFCGSFPSKQVSDLENPAQATSRISLYSLRMDMRKSQ